MNELSAADRALVEEALGPLEFSTDPKFRKAVQPSRDEGWRPERSTFHRNRLPIADMPGQPRRPKEAAPQIPDPPGDKSYAQIGFEAYTRMTGDHQGLGILIEHMPPLHKKAWVAAADAILAAYMLAQMRKLPGDKRSR